MLVLRLALQGGEPAGDPIRPRVFDIGCTGSISRCDELPDGRYNMVLGGEKRFRILEELPSDGERLYRLARVEELVEALPQGDTEREAVGRERAPDPRDAVPAGLHRPALGLVRAAARAPGCRGEAPGGLPLRRLSGGMGAKPQTPCTG